MARTVRACPKCNGNPNLCGCEMNIPEKITVEEAFELTINLFKDLKKKYEQQTAELQKVRDENEHMMACDYWHDRYKIAMAELEQTKGEVEMLRNQLAEARQLEGFDEHRTNR